MSNENKKELVSKETRKKQIRRAEIEHNGLLHLDDKYKKPGKVYRAVADKPGRIKYLESLGYEVVKDDDFVSGTEGTSKTHKLGSAQTVEMGINQSQPGVWMCIDEDLYNDRQEVKAEMNQEYFQQTTKENQYSGQEDPSE